jgi:phenylpyruvate tautomerase PptA (4-oxalocrotonate tautomerase family)
MPIIEIKALPQKEGIDTAAAMKTICVRLADKMGLEPKQVWATWTAIAPGSYTEGELQAKVQPYSTHPPLVTMLAFEGKSDREIEQAMLTIAEVLSRQLQIDPENIFIKYDETKSGRVFTGGTTIIKTKHGK